MFERYLSRNAFGVAAVKFMATVMQRDSRHQLPCEWMCERRVGIICWQEHQGAPVRRLLFNGLAEQRRHDVRQRVVRALPGRRLPFVGSQIM